MRAPVAVAGHADYGFFGPESVTWKVFGYPTAPTVAFQRTAVVEMFDPFVLASVADSGAVMNRTKLRYERTLQYMETLAFADSGTALKASQTLVRVHHRIRGVEPISGQPYDPNHPEGQLWIHLTAWHSVLLTYEVFGPGKLTPAEELQYWSECARSAELQNIHLDDVPRDRAQMRAYYERVQPRLAATNATLDHVHYYLKVAGDLLPDHLLLRPLRPLFRWGLRRATIATLPLWMRRMAGIHQHKVTDVAIAMMLRPIFRLIAHSRWLQIALVRGLSPLTAPVLTPIILGVPPTDPVVRTPEEARRAHRIPTPAEQIATLKAADAARGNRNRAPQDGRKASVVDAKPAAEGLRRAPDRIGHF